MINRRKLLLCPLARFSCGRIFLRPEMTFSDKHINGGIQDERKDRANSSEHKKHTSLLKPSNHITRIMNLPIDNRMNLTQRKQSGK